MSHNYLIQDDVGLQNGAPAAATWDQGSEPGDLVGSDDGSSGDDSDDGKDVEQVAAGIRRLRQGANIDAILFCDECGAKNDKVYPNVMPCRSELDMMLA